MTSRPPDSQSAPPGAGAPGDAPATVSLPVLPAAVFIALSWISWRRTGDILRDWGRELYTAWRLSAGDRLYRDVESLFGPLSQAFNGAIFTAFGPGHSVLLLANLIWLAASAALAWDACARLTNRRTADLATVTFLAVFGFGHLTPLGNYNFLTPYAHEATHGILLCLAVVWAVIRWQSSGSRTAAAIAGLAAGCAWLTKPEIALAATAALVTGCALGRREGLVDRRAVVGLVLPCLLLPPVTLGLALSGSVGPSEALAALARPFVAAVEIGPLSSTFYHESMGLDHPILNGSRIVLAGAGATAAYYGSARVARRVPLAVRRPLAWLLAPAAVAVSVAFGGWRAWLTLAWTLPTACVLGVAWLRSIPGETREDSVRRVGLGVWIALSAVLLLKLGLRPRFFHYGFYLSMPATFLAVMLAAYAGPRGINRERADPTFVQRLSLATIYCLSTVLALASAQAMYRRSTELLEGRDRIRVRPAEADPRTGTVVRLLAEVDPLVHRSGSRPTLSVLPEGATLNYWLRVRAPTRYPVLLPPELKAFGETTILREFEDRPADVVAAIHRDMSEYGIEDDGPVPGANRLSEWIESSYCEVLTIHTVARDGTESEASIRTRTNTEPCYP